MKINQIILYNFGSYEGQNRMVFASDKPERNIVLIGGKNGAGKTTLFQALKICLYGYRETGYQSTNAYYRRKIAKYINNEAKEKRPVQAYVEINFEMQQGAVLSQYVMRREWELSEDVTEFLSIYRDGMKLTEEEKDDFEDFLLHILPPELFNLYFLDGERVADFFLDEGSVLRLKEAFSILCGYDNFDIMYRNFKRLSSCSQMKDGVVKKYIALQEQAQSKRKIWEKKVEQEKELAEKLQLIDSELSALEKQYARKGGISRKTREQQQQELKNQENLREGWNRSLKNMANELIPFLILRDELQHVKKQIEQEEIQEEQELLQRAVKKELPPVLGEMIPEWNSSQRNAVAKKILDRLRKDISAEERILWLSRDEKERISYQIQGMLLYTKEEIFDIQEAINNSIEKGIKLREEIEKTSIEDLDEYINRKEQLLAQKQGNFEIREKLRIEKELAEDCKKEAEELESKAKKEFEAEAKKGSVTELAAKGVLFWDTLKDRLYQSQIHKVEKLFQEKIAQLKQKENFIDEIKIDFNFNIHIYEHNPEERELDVTQLSSGEKQIFIMALYWALIQLSRHEVPFIIDTPFARIDTEHREHIVEYFFKELKGQVFILSTNEEIEDEHIKRLEDKIQVCYMLENTKNKRTSVIENRYFGEVEL